MTWSEAAERNQAPIAEVLKTIFTHQQWRVLEIGSGTGQHAAYFSSVFDNVVWQTSDLVNNHQGINHNIKDCQRALAPLALDAQKLGQVTRDFNVIFTANTCHIMSWENVQFMIRNTENVLAVDGLLIIYGPFKVGGLFTSESNYRFDQYLSQVIPHQGIRDREAIVWLADKQGLSLQSCHEMPANNMLLIFKKRRR